MFAAAFCLFPAIAAADGTSALEAEVQARAERVATLRRDYDQAVDELEKAPELSPIAQTKSKYVLLQLELLLDAQGHQRDAERLRDSQRQLMENTRKVIEPALHALPAVAKLEDLGQRIATVDDDYKETRDRVVAVVAAARSVQDVGDRLADLKRRQSDLETQLARLKAKVASQKNAALKAHNEALLAKADQLLADGRTQIAELEASSAAASERLAAVTSETDLVAARATAERIRLAWNHASRQRDEAAEVLWGLCDLSTTIRLSGHGNVSKHAPDGRDIPLDLKKPVELLPGESIRTGRDSEVKLRLFDGSFIQLRENSNFTLRGVDRNDFLEGGAIHRLNRLLNHLMKDPPRRTINAVLAERGTDYVLLADETQTTCAVLNGEVEFTPTDPAVKPLVVKALQRATLTHDGWTVETITPDDYERLLASFEPNVN
jgi:hypothetical protein